MVLLQVRQFAEDLETRVDFPARKILQSLRSEALYGKRAHHAAVKEGALQHFSIDLALRCYVSHESAGKGIASSSRVLYLFNRQRGRTKWMRSNAESSLAEEDGRSVLAVLHYQSARPHRNHFLRRAREILLPCQHLGLGVVDQENVDQFQGFRQFLWRALDPEIHGVAAGQAHTIHLQTNCRLQRRVDVRKEQELRVRIFFGDARLKLFKDVQFGEVGFGLVQVVEILSAPAKGLALRALDTARVHPAFFQDGLVVRCKVFAHHGHHAHFSEITCGQGEISRGPSENVVHSAGGRGDRVKGNRTNYQNAHEAPWVSRSSMVVSRWRSYQLRKHPIDV